MSPKLWLIRMQFEHATQMAAIHVANGTVDSAFAYSAEAGAWLNKFEAEVAREQSLQASGNKNPVDVDNSAAAKTLARSVFESEN